MGFISGFAALFIVVAAAQAAGDVEETPAAPLNRTPPAYPASCEPKSGAASERQSVTISFGVARDGATEDVRVMESTDTCFEEVAVAAVRTWEYEPRRVNGQRYAQEDLEATFTFVFNEPTDTQDFDARPILRVPPQYPYRCQERAKNTESVLLQFDVTKEGTTQNIQVLESTSWCFEKPAIKSVEKWLYRPKILFGEAVEREGVVTQVTFRLSEELSLEWRFRTPVKNRLGRARRLLNRNSDPAKALAELESLEAKYGSSFSQIELSAFHQIRAAARIKAGDYKGALDDLRVVQRIGLAVDSLEAVHKTIMQLEAALAAQESEAVQNTEAPEEEH